jgi:hypothetical protein
MRGDFSRVTFDPNKAFTRVLEQQGRVQLDADWNEQMDIFWHYLRTLATDIIGPHGGPTAQDFEITTKPSPDGSRITDLGIGFGRYYVQGILCENPAVDGCGNNRPEVRYFSQPYFSRDINDDDDQISTLLPLMVYLDVWERHITPLEDDQIREVALLGPDTTTRSQVVWQVKIGRLPDGVGACADLTPEIIEQSLHPRPRGCLRARAKPAAPSTDACILPPQSRFRGFENQLYRVEIHRSGAAEVATFKWSRNNGSTVFPVDGVVDGSVVSLVNLGRDGGYSLAKDDLVEVIDDDYELNGEAQDLLKVIAVDSALRQVTLSGMPTSSVGHKANKHPLLRRWDQKSGAGTALNSAGTITVVENEWIELEDQVEIMFESNDGNYRTGDYWLIPARVATGDVIWPRTVETVAGEERSVALPKPPQGIQHFYAPLAILNTVAGAPVSCRVVIG